MNKIDNKAMASFLFFMSNQMILSIGINHILNISKQNGIYIPIISFFISLLPFFLFIRYFNYEPSKNFFEKITYTYNKLGIIINFIVFLIISFYFIYCLSTLNTYIQNKYLTETPSFFIIILFLLPVLYIVNKGIRTISKVAFILLIIYFTLFIFSQFGLMKYIEIENLMPFFDKDFLSLFESSIFFSIYTTYPIMLLLIIPKTEVKNPKTINLYLFFSFAFSIIAILITIFYLISVFGIDLVLLFDFPIFSLFKKINFFDFITHIENILSFMCITVFFINSSLSLSAIKLYINNKKLFIIFIIISLLISLLFFNDHSLVITVMKKYFIYTFLIVLLLIIKKKK